MKKAVGILLLLLTTSYFALGDVIPENHHPINRCVKITNSDQFENVSIVAYVRPMGNKNYAYVVQPDGCLHKGYKFNYLGLFAIDTKHLDGKDINNIDFNANLNAFKSNIAIDCAGGCAHDSTAISNINSYYEIIGFTDTSFVLHKWKEVTIFENGQPDLIVLYEYQGNANQYSMALSAQREFKFESKIIISPNPATDYFNFKITNNYIGEVDVEILSSTNFLVQTISFYKYRAGTTRNLTLYLKQNTFSEGLYFVRFRFGKNIQTKKIIIHR